MLVIALLMAAMTILGGTKSSPLRIEIAPGVEATVIEAEGEGQKHILIVTGPTGEVRYESESRWRIRDIDPAEGGGKVAFGSQTASKFLNRENLVLQTTNASYIAVMAVGMTAIIVLAGIDLSVGSIYALAALFGAQALNWLFPDKSSSLALTLGAALIVCGGVGALAGFANGFASVALRVHPFVITLGTMAIYRGWVFVSSGGQTVGLKSETLQSEFMKFEAGGVYPVPTIIMLLVAAGGLFVLQRTVFGRRVYAIGGNETAAVYAGIPVGRVKVLVYTISGALAGLSAMMYLGYYAAAETQAGRGYELKVIAAAVIGGASLSGGRGSAVGAVLGAILVALIDNAMLIFSIDQAYNEIVMGGAIILAVVVDQAKARLSHR